jgi:hypothetical protein
MNQRKDRSLEIMASIRSILVADWDPIHVGAEHPSEYDSYVGGVYRLLANRASAEELAEHLRKLEAEKMGFTASKSSALRPVAEKLFALEVGL